MSSENDEKNSAEVSPPGITPEAIELAAKADTARPKTRRAKDTSSHRITEALLDRATLISQLDPHPQNARRRDDRAEAELRQSLEVNGQYRTVVARELGERLQLLAGHGTVQAARQLGWTHVAVDVHAGLSDEAAARIVLVDNRTNDLAGYDDDLLAELLSSLDDLAGSGFTDADLAALLAGAGDEPAALTDPDYVPEPPEDPISALGDVWQLGPHRLIVGDSTMVDVWDKLCQGQPADLLFTDPPYGMSYGGGRGKQNKGAGQDKGFGQIENDDLTGSNLIDLVRDAMVAALPHRKPDSPAYVCFTWRTYAEFEEALRQADMQPKACIVWNKGSIGLSHGHYRPQHEFIFYVQGQWYGDRAQSDVWTLGRDRLGDYAHPTQKPVELVMRALENSSKPGDIVADAFGGSGSTLIACHATTRKARLVELDPKYADVICRRYQEHTGVVPILEATGEPVDFTTAKGE